MPHPTPLFIFSQTWEYAALAPDDVAALAGRLEAKVGSPLASPRLSTMHHYSTKLRAAGATSAAALGDEVRVRAAGITQISVESCALQPGQTTADVKATPVVERGPVGSHSQWEAAAPPIYAHLLLQAQPPALRLEVRSIGALAGESLFSDLRAHVSAHARPRVWDPDTAALLGFSVAAATPDALLLTGAVSEPVALLTIFPMAGIGWLSGLGMHRWLFPRLELTTGGEGRTRWKRCLQLATAVIGIGGAIAGVVALTLALA